MTTDGPHEDWIAVLTALEKGDPEAVATVTAVILGWLAHCGAYDRRDAWDHKALGDLLAAKIHALSMDLHAPDEV